MATNKKTAKAEGSSYQAGLKDFGSALDLLRKGSLEKARTAFDAIATEFADEPELAQRATTYSRVCVRKMPDDTGEPCTPDEWYYQGVVHSNLGRSEQALEYFNKALQQDPTSAKFLYARASTQGREGNTEAAVHDLRQAVLADPTVRFQAVNDSDFEPIRDDAGFIDLIEPTPVEG